MQIHDGLILQHVTDTEKNVPCAFQETTRVVPLADTMVWRKRAWHRVKTNQIGDGMQTPLVLERPFMLVHIQPEWVLMGMSVYQEFDEAVGCKKTYLYKFPSTTGSLERVQEILSSHISGYTVVRAGRFVQLRGEQIVYEEDIKKFTISLMHGGVGTALSFLWGLCIGYGDVMFELMPDSLHITLPLVGSSATREPYIHAVLTSLAQHGMFVSSQTQNQSFGQALQIRITDWEIITIFASWLGYELKHVIRKRTYESMKKQALEWLVGQTVDRAFLDTVEYSVVKLVKK